MKITSWLLTIIVNVNIALKTFSFLQVFFVNLRNNFHQTRFLLKYCITWQTTTDIYFLLIVCLHENIKNKCRIISSLYCECDNVSYLVLKAWEKTRSLIMCNQLNCAQSRLYHECIKVNIVVKTHMIRPIHPL